MLCFEKSKEGSQITSEKCIFIMHVAVTLIFIVCIGYLAKSGGHLLLRVEIEVMLDGEY